MIIIIFDLELPRLALMQFGSFILCVESRWWSEKSHKLVLCQGCLINPVGQTT